MKMVGRDTYIYEQEISEHFGFPLRYSKGVGNLLKERKSNLEGIRAI